MAAAVLLLFPEITVEVKDLSPKFLAFFEAAVDENAGPERRFQRGCAPNRERCCARWPPGSGWRSR